MKRKIFDRLFPRLEGERSARGPMIAADHLAVLLGQPLGEVCRSGELIAEGLLKAQQIYRSDFIIVFADVSVEAEALGVRLEYFPHGNPQPVFHPAIDDLKPVHLPETGRMAELFEAAAICRAMLPNDMPVFFSMKDPFSLAAMTIGTELFLGMLITEREKAVHLLEFITDMQMDLAATIARSGYIPFVGAPIASGGLIGARYFQQFARPYLEQVFAVISEQKVQRCLHICGEIAMLTDEIRALRLDVLSFEDASEPFWKRLPDTIPMGYIPTDLFYRSDAGRMRSAVTACKQALTSPYILSSGCDIPPHSDPELVQIMMSA